MESPDILSLAREGITVLMIVSAPMLITALVVGLAISLFQALTQIQETTLTFVPKMAAMLIVMLLALPIVLQSLQDYTVTLFNKIATIE